MLRVTLALLLSRGLAWLLVPVEHRGSLPEVVARIREAARQRKASCDPLGL